uniref:Uncharacterized protein n=1 Tax=Cyprinus carpio TaxID=7962 RepID=A0A8C1JUX9_CYPCA
MERRPGTRPTRWTTLLMLMFSRLTPFTSSSLSPTHRPASSTHTHTHTHQCTHTTSST